VSVPVSVCVPVPDALTVPPPLSPHADSAATTPTILAALRIQALSTRPLRLSNTRGAALVVAGDRHSTHTSSSCR